MSIRFYGWPRSSASRVHWALEELGVPHEHVVLDRAKNEHHDPAYLAINPNGKVPALVDDGQPYFSHWPSSSISPRATGASAGYGRRAAFGSPRRCLGRCGAARSCTST
jgi:Glutathione S-transferase, N-terminal domain